MKKRFVITFSLIAVIAIPLTGFLFLVYFPFQPETKSKIFEAIKIIDLKNLPKDSFLQVSIGGGEFEKDYQPFFEVPADKMTEFEAGFRSCVKNAAPLKGMLGCLSPELKIKTEKGNFSAYICYDDDDVTIYRNDIFHRGFVSRELRKVFYDAGLEYTSGGPKPPRKKDANEPNHLEILRQSGLKSMEYARRMKEANEKQKELSEPNNKIKE